MYDLVGDSNRRVLLTVLFPDPVKPMRLGDFVILSLLLKIIRCSQYIVILVTSAFNCASIPVKLYQILWKFLLRSLDFRALKLIRSQHFGLHLYLFVYAVGLVAI